MRPIVLAQLAVASAYTLTGSVAGSVAHAAATRPRGASLQMIELIKPANVDQVKKQFNAAYGRPVGGVAQGFVSEILQSTCFALQSPKYAYSRIYAVGYEELCKAFLEGCPSDEDREAIRSSMLIGLGMDPAKVQRDAEELLALAEGMAEAELLETADFKDVAAIDGFKYTYTFGAGLITLMPVVKTEPSNESIERWCSALKIGARLQTDYAYYKSSLEKVGQAKEMMLQMQVASKRAEAKRLAAKAEAAAKEAEEEEAKAAAAGTSNESQ